MEIIRLAGTDKRLYEFIAPLVMNPAILRQNNNYPFKTSIRHIWYLAIENNAVSGFIPVEKNGNTLHIDNYYICGDNSCVITELLNKIISELDAGHKLTALVHKRHVEDFRESGFELLKQWTKYDKMKYKLIKC